jgi:WD40 repeat protein
VWDLDSGQPLATLTGHESSVLSVAVTTDGRRAVSASLDRTLRVWDLDKGICLAVVALDGALYAVAISPDRKTIVAGIWAAKCIVSSMWKHPPLTPPVMQRRREDC